MRNVTIIHCVLLFFICLSSCGLIERNKARKDLLIENGRIPPEFGKTNDEVILVFELIYPNAKRKSRIKFGEDYKGKSRIIKKNKDFWQIPEKKEPENIIGPQNDPSIGTSDGANTYYNFDTLYNDLDKYRYVFGYDFRQVPNGDLLRTLYDFYIYDRKEGRYYWLGFEVTHPLRVTDAYIENLNSLITE